MTSMGLHVGRTLLFFLIGALVAPMAAYYTFGRKLPTVEVVAATLHGHPVLEAGSGILDVINRSGSEAFKIAVGVVPMPVFCLLRIAILQYLSILAWITAF